MADERQQGQREGGGDGAPENVRPRPAPGKTSRTKALGPRPPRAKTMSPPVDDPVHLKVIHVDAPGAPGDALTASTEPRYRRVAAEDTLKSLLAIRVSATDVRAQQQRRRMLIDAFEAIPASDREALQFRLSHVHQGDDLAQYFHNRLHRATRRLLIDVLDLVPVIHPTPTDSVEMSAFLASVDAEDLVTIPERLVLDEAWRGEAAVSMSMSLVTPYGPPGDADQVEARWSLRDRGTDEILAASTSEWPAARADVPPLEATVRGPGVYEARLEIVHRGLLLREVVRDLEVVAAGAEDLLDLLRDGDVVKRIAAMTPEQLSAQAAAVRRRMAQLAPDQGPGSDDYELLRYTLNEIEVAATTGDFTGGRPSTTLVSAEGSPSISYNHFFGNVTVEASTGAEVRARLEEAIIAMGEVRVAFAIHNGHVRSSPEADAAGLNVMVLAQLAILQEENQNFRDQFGATAKTIGFAMLSESRRELIGTMGQYNLEHRPPGTGPGAHAPGPFDASDQDELALLVSAAKELKQKHEVLVEAEKTGALNDAYHDTAPDDGSVSDVEAYRNTEQLARDDYMRSRAIAIEEHPALLAYLGEGQNLGSVASVAEKQPGPDLAATVGSTMDGKLANIDKARSGIESGDLSVWKNPDLVSLTSAQMRVPADSMRGRLVRDKSEEDDGSWFDELLLVVTFALGILLAIPSGGSSLVIAGEIALLAADLYMIGQELERYQLGMAASNTDLSRSESLIAEEPSMAGLLIQIAATAVGASGVASAVRRARGLRAAIRETAGNLADPRVAERIHGMNALGARYGDDLLGDRLAREALEHADDAGRMTRSGSDGADALMDPAEKLARDNLARAARGELGHHAVAGYVRNEDTGRALLRRLADGDDSALVELGARMPDGKSAFDVEWGLAKQWDGKLVIVHGSPGAVDWAHLPGLTAIQHTHPFRAIAGAAADQGGRSIDDLARGVDDYYKLFPSPSDAEYALRNSQRGHVVSTPFISLGGGKIANPGPGVTGPGVDFVLEDVEYAGRWAYNDKWPVFKAKVVAKADGKPIWDGELWFMEHAGRGDIIQKAALPISANKLPLPPESWRLTRSGDDAAREQADLMTQYGIKNRKAADAGQPTPYPDVDAAARSSADELATVRERGYPHGFESAEEFAEFGDRVKGALKTHQIDTGTVAVHGSAVHRANPKDIDIAVLVDKDEFDRLAALIDAETKLDKVRKKLGKEIAKGKIPSFYFPRVDGGQLVRTLDDARNVQVSVILKGSEFDLGPYVFL